MVQPQVARADLVWIPAQFYIHAATRPGVRVIVSPGDPSQPFLALVCNKQMKRDSTMTHSEASYCATVYVHELRQGVKRNVGQAVEWQGKC